MASKAVYYGVRTTSLSELGFGEVPRNNSEKPSLWDLFSQNFVSEFSKKSDPPAEPKLESEFWPNSDPSSGFDNLVRTSPRGSCTAF